MKKISLAYICIGLFVLMAGCNNRRYYSADPFYSSTGEWDSIRIPLIKPYEAVSIQGSDSWYINLLELQKTGILYISVPDIQKIAVMNDVILAYTSYEPDHSENMGDRVLYWFVIIPSMKIETGFNNEGNFLKYIQEHGIYDIIWESPDSIYQRFGKSGCLEWIPGCQ